MSALASKALALVGLVDVVVAAAEPDCVGNHSFCVESGCYLYLGSGRDYENVIGRQRKSVSVTCAGSCMTRKKMDLYPSHLWYHYLNQMGRVRVCSTAPGAF